MASNSGLTGWLESRALQHKKHHENILGEQKYPGLRLMFLKTVGPYEVQSDGQMMWFEMADKDHRINVVIPGLVVREFNSQHATPLHSRRHELLSIEEFHFVVMPPAVDTCAAGQPEPTFGIKVLKLREYGGGGDNVVRGRISLRQGGGMEVKAWIEGLENMIKGEEVFAKAFDLEKQQTLAGFEVEGSEVVKPTVRSLAALDKGKGVERGEGGASPKKQSRKAFNYSRYEAPRTLGAAISGCAPNVQERLRTAWGVEANVTPEIYGPQPRASTSKLPLPLAPAPSDGSGPRRRSRSFSTSNSPRRISGSRPEDQGPPRKLARAELAESAPRPPTAEQLGPPNQLARTHSFISAPLRPPSLDEQGVPNCLTSAAPRPLQPEELGPPPKLARLNSSARSTANTLTTYTRSTSHPSSSANLEAPTQSQSDKVKVEQPSSPSLQPIELNSSDLKTLEAEEKCLVTRTATQAALTSSPERVYEWPSSPLPAEEVDHQILSQAFSTAAPTIPQAGQRPTDSVHYSQFPQESISVEVSMLEVMSQVPGQPVGGQGVEGREEEDEEGEEEGGELPPSKQGSGHGGGRGGKMEEAARSSDDEIKEEEEDAMEWETTEMRNGKEESGEEEEEESEEIDVFGIGGRRKRARYSYDEDDHEYEGSMPSSSSSPDSNSLRPRPRPHFAGPQRINYLASSSSPNPTHSQAATHVSESQPTRSDTRISQPEMEREESIDSSSSSNSRKREREQYRTVNDEEEEMKMELEEEQEQKRLKISAPSTSGNPGVATLAASQTHLHLVPHTTFIHDNLTPFNLTPSQLALFVAEQEAWSKPISLPPIAVVLGPWAREQGLKAGTGG